MSLEKAIRIGELLANIKSELVHGQWLFWLEQNLSFSDRTARNYVRCFEQRDRLKSETISNLTDAYNLLGEPKITPPPWAKPEYPMESFQNAYEIVEIAALICADKGRMVTPDEYLELGFCIMEGLLELRFDKHGRVEFFKDGRWLPAESEDLQLAGTAA
jgi:hypothetical protein